MVATSKIIMCIYIINAAHTGPIIKYPIKPIRNNPNKRRCAKVIKANGISQAAANITFNIRLVIQFNISRYIKVTKAVT